VFRGERRCRPIEAQSPPLMAMAVVIESHQGLRSLVDKRGVRETIGAYSAQGDLTVP